MARVQMGFGLFGVLAVVVTVSLVMRWNPLPEIGGLLSQAGDQLSRFQGKLTDPAPQWTVRAGGPPDTGAVLGDRVVIGSDGIAEGRHVDDGRLAWQREVDWLMAAGELVVAGRRAGPGFEVLSPSDGAVRWTDAGAADVWAYRDLLLALSCKDGGCTLRGRSLYDGAVRWQLRLGGRVERLLSTAAVHPDAEPAATLPVAGAVPDAEGVLIDGHVTMFNPRTGKRLADVDADRNTQVRVSGGLVLRFTARTNDGGCRYTVEARRPSGGRAWQRDGYNPGTVAGAACEQRGEPMLAGGMLAVTRNDGRPAVVDVASGRARWVGGGGDKVVAVSSEAAAVRTADGAAVVNLKTGKQVWRDRLPDKVETVATSYGLVFVATTANRLVAVDATGKVRRNVEGSPSILAASSEALVLTNGRTLGYLTW